MKKISLPILLFVASTLTLSCASRDKTLDRPNNLTDVENPLKPETLGLEPNPPAEIEYSAVSPVADGLELKLAGEQTLRSARAKIQLLDNQIAAPANDSRSINRRIGYLMAGIDKVTEELNEYSTAHLALTERERIEAVEAINELRSNLALIDSRFR